MFDRQTDGQNLDSNTVRMLCSCTVKFGVVSATSNYRPIALTTIFSQVLEHLLLNRMNDYLYTSDNQFGFNRGHFTLMPMLLLKEVLRTLLPR